MTIAQKEKIFYEAIWFSRDNSNHPIVKGLNVEEIINELLEITKGKDGCIEVYQIAYNDIGYKINLYKKFEVLNKLELYQGLISRI